MLVVSTLEMDVFIRSKVVKGATYFQVIEGYRDEQGRVRHRTVGSLGQCPTPRDAIEANKKCLARLGRRLARWEPIAEHSQMATREAERLRTAIERLTQQNEKLTAMGKALSVDTTTRKAKQKQGVAEVGSIKKKTGGHLV
jgi:hypothetical protein